MSPSIGSRFRRRVGSCSGTTLGLGVRIFCRIRILGRPGLRTSDGKPDFTALGYNSRMREVVAFLSSDSESTQKFGLYWVFCGPFGFPCAELRGKIGLGAGSPKSGPTGPSQPNIERLSTSRKSKSSKQSIIELLMLLHPYRIFVHQLSHTSHF